MSSLHIKAFAGLAILFVTMALLLFGAAGTLRYWQGWTSLACYFAASIVITVYLMKNDPALLKRRMRGGPFAEKEPAQKIIMSIASLGFVALLVLPGFDYRYGWSRMPESVVLAGDLLVLLGWSGIFLVFRVNSFTSSTIELATDHRVISTGPYAIVRHPMYAAALVMLLGIPVSLGSWWSAFVVIVLFPVLVWRLKDEERLLARNLPGYVEYQNRVRYRLLPGVW